MFRSLFIGFLILSAITSRNAGIQINQSTDLSPDILLQLFNTAFSCCDEQLEPSDSDAALLGCAHKDVNINKLVQIRKIDLSYCYVPAIYTFTAVFFYVLLIFFKQEYYSYIYLGISDLSPPYCVECA